MLVDLIDFVVIDFELELGKIVAVDFGLVQQCDFDFVFAVVNFVTFVVDNCSESQQ